MPKKSTKLETLQDIFKENNITADAIHEKGIVSVDGKLKAFQA